MSAGDLDLQRILAGARPPSAGDRDARIEMVASAIGRHGAPLRSGEGTPEEICLSNADAMAQITAPAFWLFFAFTLRKLDFAAGKDWYARKVRENWDAIVPEARALIRAEHARALAVAG